MPAQKQATYLRLVSAVVFSLFCFGCQNPDSMPVGAKLRSIVAELYSPGDQTTAIQPLAPIFVSAYNPGDDGTALRDSEFTSQVADAIQHNVTLTHTHSFTTIALMGQWTKSAYRRVLEMRPVQPLAVGEYAAKLAGGPGYSVADTGQRRVFYVGSMPRVNTITFAANAGNLSQVTVEFSEPMEKSTVLSAVSVQYNASSLTATSFSVSEGGNLVTMDLAGPSLSDQVKVVVAVSATAKDGRTHLDGKGTGVPGSGPFELSVAPETLSNWTWNRP